MKPADKQCYLCSATVNSCQTCSDYFVCQTCIAPKVLNTSDTTSSGQCIPCPLTGCTTCLNITACQLCDFGNSYGILHDLTCYPCNASIQ